jgi:hypothetical protein
MDKLFDVADVPFGLGSLFLCSTYFSALPVVSEIYAVVIPLLFGLYTSRCQIIKPYASLLSSLIYLWSIYREHCVLCLSLGNHEAVECESISFSNCKKSVSAWCGKATSFECAFEWIWALYFRKRIVLLLQNWCHVSSSLFFFLSCGAYVVVKYVILSQ